MDVINMAEKSNEDRNKFEINDDISIGHHSGSFQCSFGQKIVENAKEVAIVAEKSNEEQQYKFNLDVPQNTSNQALAAPQTQSSGIQNTGQANDQLNLAESPESGPSESMSEYFQHKTSNLGYSLGSHSGSKLSIPRPDFGLEIHNSPKPKPVTLVTAADVLEEAVSLSISKQYDLTVKEKQEIHEVAKLVLSSSPGHETNYYAQIVLKTLLEKQLKELETTLHVTQFLPSFLESSTEISESPQQIVLKSAEKKRNSISQRHSSPKKQQDNMSKNKNIPAHIIEQPKRSGIPKRVLPMAPLDVPEKLEKPNQTSEIPKQTSEIPKQTSEIFKKTSVVHKKTSKILEHTSSALPTQNARMPKQNSEIPKQNSEIPKQSSGIPNQNSGIPKLTSETPNENTGISKQNSGIPNQNSKYPTKTPD